MFAYGLSNLQLCTYAVSSRNKQWCGFKASLVQIEDAAESANFG